MRQDYTDDRGKVFTATIAGNLLTMFVPRGDTSVQIKIPPQHAGTMRRAIRQTDFRTFTAAVDKVVSHG